MLLSLLALIAVFAYLVFLYHWSKKRQAIDQMVAVANDAGADTFTDIENNYVTYKLFDRASLSDIEILTGLFSRYRKTWSPQDIRLFSSTWERATGQRI